MSDEKKVDDETKKEPKEPVDDLVISHHTLRTTAGEITYTARTGRIVLREEEVRTTSSRAGRPARSCRSRRTRSTTPT